MWKTSILFVLLVISIICTAQETRLVPQEYNSITQALLASNSGDIILVSPGTYNDNIIWPANAAGVELRSTDGASSTIIDGSSLSRVIHISDANIGASTIIDGFTIQNGRLDVPNSRAAGIMIDGASPTLRNLIIQDNDSSGEFISGAGLHIFESESRVENCIIKNNSISSTNWALGAGVYLKDSNVIFDNCTIENNTNSCDKWSFGGGICIDESDVVLTRCTIAQNSTDGIWSDGAGIYVLGFPNGAPNKVQILGCTITGNTPLDSSSNGSALYAYNPLEVNLVNTLIHNNGESSSTLYFEGLTANLYNVTMADNQSGILCREAVLDIKNSIFWENNTFVTITNWGAESTVNVNHSLVQGGYAGENNISSDPLFIHESSYALSEESPCLNAGSIDIDYNTDILGNNRPAPAGSNPDMGAYEIDQLFSHVLTQFYLDGNTNGTLDSDEEFIAKGAIVHNDDSEISNIRAEGIFTIIDLGSHTISYSESHDPLWYLTSTPSEYSFEVAEEDFADTIYFGLSSITELAELKTAIYSPDLRCNRTITMEFSVTNLGTIKEDGILWASIDPRVSEIAPLTAADITETHRYGWYFEGLVPGETFTRLVSFKVPGIDEIEQGELLHFKSEAISSINEATKDEFNYADDVRCAYDPNDKLVNPNREDNLVLRDKEITYTIRFQNVGNDYADDVLVVDTLDTNLDLSSFNLLNTSHPDQLRYSMSSDGILKFDFHQIFLPDSTTNEPESHGFIMYSIKPDSMIAPTTIIENTAHIYFDFNPAIVTNTTSNIVTLSFPTPNNVEDEYLSEISMYPNPSFGIVHFSDMIEEIEILDLNGKLILHEKETRRLDMPDHINGTYIARISHKGQVHYKKIVLVE